MERNRQAFSSLPEKEKRRSFIVSWLQRSKFATLIKPINGSFYISGSSSGKLKNGKVINIKEWLYEEGIKEGLIIPAANLHNYKIHYDRKENRLYFSCFA